MEEQTQKAGEIIQFSGLITQSLIAHVVDVLDEKISPDSNGRALHRKLLSVSVELLQNISHYGIYEGNDQHHGQFEINESEQYFDIRSTNWANEENTNKALGALNMGNQLSETELRDLIFERASGRNEYSAGIGLFTILIACSKEVVCTTSPDRDALKISFHCRLNKKSA
jgi:Family of unknown function (DUF6272)